MQSHSTAECPEKPVEFVEYVGFTKKLAFKLQNFGLQKEREVVEEFWLFSDDLIRRKLS